MIDTHAPSTASSVKPDSASFSIRKVLVVGTGTMGQGIAQISATAGYVTHLYDVDPARIDKAIGAIKAAADRLVTKGRMLNEARSEMIGMLVASPELGPAAANVDLVIEAASENSGHSTSYVTINNNLVYGGNVAGIYRIFVHT